MGWQQQQQHAELKWRDEATGTDVVCQPRFFIFRTKHSYQGIIVPARRLAQTLFFPHDPSSFFVQGHSLWETETTATNKQKWNFCGESFVNTALWAPKHGNSALQNLRFFVGGCFPLPTYRNSANFCRWLDKFSSPQKWITPSQARSGGRDCSFQGTIKDRWRKARECDSRRSSGSCGMGAGAAVVVHDRWSSSSCTMAAGAADLEGIYISCWGDGPGQAHRRQRGRLDGWHRRSSRDGLCTSVRAVRSRCSVRCWPSKCCRYTQPIFNILVMEY